MTLTVSHPHTGVSKTYQGLTQAKINKYITWVSYIQDRIGEVRVIISVADQDS